MKIEAGVIREENAINKIDEYMYSTEYASRAYNLDPIGGYVVTLTIISDSNS